MASQAQTQALARINDLPKHPLAKVEELRVQFAALQDRCNLITPVAAIDSIPAMHAISLRMVAIDPSECYADSRFCGANEVALGGVGLQKIAAAAGVQMLGTRRLDDRSDPHYCAMEVTIAMRDYDGTYRQVNKAKEIDLRKGSAEAGRMKDGEIANARKHIQSLCETKAFYRAIRTLLSLKQKYTKTELQKPFVVPKLVPALDPNDPEQKAALIGMALGSEQKLFGAPKEQARELRDVTPPGIPPPPLAPPPVGKVAIPDPDDEGDAHEDAPDESVDAFDALDVPAAGLILCLCPCSCQRELTAAAADLTMKKVGAPRCAECFPGRAFRYEAHKDLKDLGLPLMKGRTADDVRKAQLAAEAKK